MYTSRWTLEWIAIWAKEGRWAHVRRRKIHGAVYKRKKSLRMIKPRFETDYCWYNEREIEYLLQRQSHIWSLNGWRAKREPASPNLQMFSHKFCRLRPQLLHTLEVKYSLEPVSDGWGLGGFSKSGNNNVLAPIKRKVIKLPLNMWDGIGIMKRSKETGSFFIFTPVIRFIISITLS